MSRLHMVTAGLCLPLLLATLSACGGGGGLGSNGPVEAPMVRNVSPWISPVIPNTSEQLPTFTNATLTSGTDTRYPGAIVVYFQGATDVDPASLFIGGTPFNGADPSAITIEREVPGVGNLAVPCAITLSDAAGSGTANAIVCRPLPPYATTQGTQLPEGQYTIGIYDGVRATSGKRLQAGPVFHTFTVGSSDTILPRVITTDPVRGEQGVGAGTAPPPPPPGLDDSNIATVTTNIFGSSTPDVTIRFSESVRASSITEGAVQVTDAGAFIPGGGAPPPLPPAPGYPRVRDIADGQTLPSNGHQIVMRVDPQTGGFPFGTQIQVRVKGAWLDAASRDANPNTPDSSNPVLDLAGNAMELDYVFSFSTIAPPDLPENPFPEYAIWWSASDRVGAIDTINQRGLGDQFLGTQFPNGVPQNVLPEFTDTIATSANIPGFDPLEINFDGRTNLATCHTWIYVQSHESGQIAILNSRDGLPVALLDTPSPGGIAVQVGAGSANTLLATNAGANTFTAFDIGLQTPGVRFLNAPVFISKVQPTGNTPKAISITSWGADAPVEAWNRDGAFNGPNVPMIMYADFSDGVVNTIRLSDNAPVRQFALGPDAAPNDVCFSPCFLGATGPTMYAAISQGGNGKIAFYAAGPGCSTGRRTNAAPDAIVGDLNGFEAPDGLDENLQSNTPVFFSVAESGSNSIATLGMSTDGSHVPQMLNRFSNVGENPTKIAHRASWFNPGISVAVGRNSCTYGGTQQVVLDPLWTRRDWSMTPTKDLYICARGSSQVTVIDLTSGIRRFYGVIDIPGVRFVAGPATQ